MSDVLFRLSDLPVTRYGAAVALAALLSLMLTTRREDRLGPWVRFAFCTVLFGWLGARLMFVLPDLVMGWLNELGVIAEHNSVYLNAIGSAVPALYFWEGGYSLAGLIPGAILGAAIAEAATHARRGEWRDRLAMALPAFMLVERLAEYGSDIGTGVEIGKGWLTGLGICPAEGGTYFHPLCLYEALTALVVLIIMVVLSFNGRKRPGGDLLRLCLVFLCLPTVALEAFRPLTGHMIIHFVNVTQVVMMLLALVPAIRWSHRISKSRHGGGLRVGIRLLGWLGIGIAIGLAVYCIFGMEKDWVSRGTAYALIALSMAAVGGVALSFRAAAGRKE